MILKSLFGMGGGGEAPSALYGRIPGGERVYAVGDIHGCDAQLEKLLELIVEDGKGFNGKIGLLFIGDYVDRGPGSAAVVERLRKLDLPQNWETVFLRGNHEQGMLDFMADPKGMPHWLGWGGLETLASYGVAVYEYAKPKLPENIAEELKGVLAERGDLAWLEETQLYKVIGGYLFVHAGVRPGVPLHRQLETDLFFIREDFVGRPHGLPYCVVYGHTIGEAVMVQDDRIALDTGAYAGGPLSAVALEGAEVRVLQVESACSV